ncbi:MAG: uroporphyrinogen decarboxylase family protein [Candidatus Izemoplasmatales bacterium]|jgi:uroporphyrinogen decarboxylase|nr:uroporphyrinogen decarboxylase family protein [Candidatus Izemoplasmatales bacterium]
MFRNPQRLPDFHNLELILNKKTAPRAVLFDFIIGDEKEKMLVGDLYNNTTEFDRVLTDIRAFDSAGFDHACIVVRGMNFDRKSDPHTHVSTKSLNSGATIVDWQSFHDYQWPKITDCDFSILDKAGKFLSPNVKFIPFSLDGILENTIGIMGYENLCLNIYDDPDLVGAVFEQVGKRIEEYFTECLKSHYVGAILCNDDWGFNSQTMLPPDLLRRWVFPWYKRIVAKAHASGKFAILHSCGYFMDIIDDIIDDMQFDGRHSYEDKIMKVEDAYELLYPRIAVLGGMDVNFLSRSTSAEIYDRAKKMLIRTKNRGGYALGSGNSIPDYISNDNYLALLMALQENGEH